MVLFCEIGYKAALGLICMYIITDAPCSNVFFRRQKRKTPIYWSFLINLKLSKKPLS